jgi:hypothetical protein
MGRYGLFARISMIIIGAIWIAGGALWLYYGAQWWLDQREIPFPHRPRRGSLLAVGPPLLIIYAGLRFLKTAVMPDRPRTFENKLRDGER